MADQLRRGMGANSIRARTAALRMFFRFLKFGGLIQYDPMAAISHRKVPRRLPRVLTVEEVESLINASRDPFERAVIEVMYATGVRVSELVSIKLENIILPEHMILIENGKGRKDRWALYGRAAALAITKYQEWRPPESGYLFESPARNGCLSRDRRRADNIWWVAYYPADGRQRKISLGRDSALRFPSEVEARREFERLVANMPEGHRPRAPRPAGPYSPRTIYSLVARLAVRAGGKGVHPHAFRRAMACHMLAHGADIRHVQELLGHNTVVTTQIYTTLTDEKLREIHVKYHPHAGGSDAAKKDD